MNVMQLMQMSLVPIRLTPDDNRSIDARRDEIPDLHFRYDATGGFLVAAGCRLPVSAVPEPTARADAAALAAECRRLAETTGPTGEALAAAREECSRVEAAVAELLPARLSSVRAQAEAESEYDAAIRNRADPREARRRADACAAEAATVAAEWRALEDWRRASNARLTAALVAAERQARDSWFAIAPRHAGEATARRTAARERLAATLAEEAAELLAIDAAERAFAGDIPPPVRDYAPVHTSDVPLPPVDESPAPAPPPPTPTDEPGEHVEAVADGPADGEHVEAESIEVFTEHAEPIVPDPDEDDEDDGEEHPVPAEDRRVRVLECRAAGMSGRQIAATLGLHQTQVQRILKAAADTVPA